MSVSSLGAGDVHSRRPPVIVFHYGKILDLEYKLGATKTFSTELIRSANEIEKIGTYEQRRFLQRAIMRFCGPQP
ncbi:hypothetical protein JZX87_19305 [Agrobacterium sp. Ap1]|uniref:hypothetical protein n=1 Tax=Agrobacterium sp. Ap1 TaxID=2815337 RepID=UPI001A908526|nr:hypothetical protein [Agrobacterium sp. Ap1]MBO0143323.1 hypothetical protein [Agrobacterium sp. Ap1]